MGVFFDYTAADKLNHIHYVIMAYEWNATLSIDRRNRKTVGPYWIMYEHTTSGKTYRYLESYGGPHEWNKWTPNSQQKEIGKGVLLSIDAEQILEPLFCKIRELEEKIKFLKQK